jgi:hypothetical protein
MTELANALINLASAAVLAYAAAKLKAVKDEATRIRRDVETELHQRDPSSPS